MRLETKKSIDSWVGVPLLCLLALASKLVRTVVPRRSPPSRNTPRAIAVAKFQGVGSVILAKPAFAELRARFPRTHLVFWGSSSTAAIAQEMPEFDEVLVLDESNAAVLLVSLARNLIHLWMLRLDWIFDLEVYSKFSTLFATLTFARGRVGFAVDSVRLRRNLHTHLVTFNRYEYLGRAYRRLLGLVAETSNESNDWSFGSWRSDLSPLSRLTAPYVVINLHAGELALVRKWPLKSFETLIDELLNAEPSTHVVLIGRGADEIAETQKIASRPRIANLAGELTTAETLRCLRHAKLVISADSAPLHMALSLGTPVVGLFGPTRLESYLPREAPRVRGLSRRLYCSPCVHHWEPPPCGGRNVCMQAITVDEVLRTACELLNWPTPSTSSDEPVVSLGSFYPGLVHRDAARPDTET